MRYWDTRQAAIYLNLSPRTLEKYRSSKTGPKYYRAGRRRVVYQKKDLDRWIINND